jgi:hypothetical protein
MVKSASAFEKLFEDQSQMNVSWHTGDLKSVISSDWLKAIDRGKNHLNGSPNKELW